MISYRVETEGASPSGNNLSFEVYETIRQLSLEGDTKIPQYAWGTWPHHAKRPEQYQPQQAKVFLDRECLLDGYDFEACFLQALSSSILIVYLLSFSEHGRGSLGALTTLCPSEGKDRVDNVLLELIVGLELQAIGKHTAQSAPCAILPILLGPQRQDSSFERFPFDKLGLLSPEPSVLTNNRAATILAMLGVGEKQIQAMQARSVRQHVDLILKNEGVEASIFVNQDELVLESARRCLMVIKRELFNYRTHQMCFTNNRPAGQEVLDWLRENQLSSYAPLFVHYCLDSLLSVANLSRQQVSRLAEEYGEIELSLGSRGPAWSGCGLQTQIQSELHLWEAIVALERDPRSRKMAWRLEWFEDAALDAFTRIYTKSQIERFMELDRFFMTIAIIVLFNLVLLQTTFVSWTDYFRESYMHKIDEFLVVSWKANLRNLGYNGRTTQRDLARIVYFLILRKAFVLSLVWGKPGEEDATIELMIRMSYACFVLPIVKYRPEWYATYHMVGFILHTLVPLMWQSPSLGTAASIIMMFVVCISAFYYDFVRRTFWDTKTCERMARFRNAWKDSYDRNFEAVSQLAQRCKEICGVLSQQRDDALETLGLFGKVQACLDERVGRWLN